jgi:hypothetical protein
MFVVKSTAYAERCDGILALVFMGLLKSSLYTFSIRGFIQIVDESSGLGY